MINYHGINLIISDRLAELVSNENLYKASTFNSGTL